MRVYEFAKQVGISSKEIVAALQEKGFAVASHMSVLEGDALTFAQEKFSPKPSVKKEAIQKKKEMPAKAVASVKEKLAKEEAREKKQPAPIKDRPPVHIQRNVTSKRFKKDKKEEPLRPQPVVIRPMTVADIAQKAAQPVNELILTLLKWGIMAAKNQILSQDLISRLVKHYELEVIEPEVATEKLKTSTAQEGAVLKPRLPIITVLGHVDHGKTTLLDFIRKTRVASREKGGITQHLGAYEASTSQGNIVFLDTPGHAAFSKIRQRGVKVADIAIIVIAADDGIMPQTLEAIEHAKSMHVPIIVAINKVDKVDAPRIEVVKRQLAQNDLLPEDWGGQVICVPISAKLGMGIDNLLEMIVLQSQMMELRANFEGDARGYVLESKIEKGRGPVATIICQHGMIHLGDYFVAGTTGGKVSSLVDSYGKRLTEVTPSIPVQVAGFQDLPEAGDYFEVVPKEDFRKALNLAHERKALPTSKLIEEGSLNLIVKTDTDSSKEALIESINKLSRKSEVGFNIIHSSVGNISESDIELAFNTGSSIIGLHVKTEANAALLAQRRAVIIDQFDIIYKLLEELEARAEGAKEIEMISTKVGEAEVLRVFDIKNIGVIAGSIVRDGRFTREGTVIAWRGREKIGEGKIRSLQRDKKTVKEVHAGFECGFIVEGISDWMPGDRVECFISLPKK
jgi:translation initiation factor IF-2